MMNVNFLLKLSETDKRFIIAFICIILVILAFLIFIVLLISYISKKQSYKIDALMHDVVITGVIDSKKKFIKVARIKNANYFFKSASIPFALLLISFIVLLIYSLSLSISFSSLFSDYSEKGYGFATILYIYDFNNIKFVDTIFGSFPQEIPLLNTPHFSLNALLPIIFIFIIIISGIWFLMTVQAYLARTIRSYKLATSIYQKRLDNVRFDNLINFKYQNGNVTYTKVNENNIEENTNNQNVENK